MANEVATTKKQGIASFLAQEAVKANVESVVGQKDSQRFISSVVSAVQTNPQLAECTNSSILSAALLGQSLNLPQSPQLSYFYIVPYNNKKKIKDEKGKETEITVKEGVFQLGYRGYLQLAMRSGQYQKIHATEIKEGELKSYNPITDEFEFEPIMDYAERQKKPVAGYYGYFVLNNGSKKELYWDKARMEAHAKKYSAAYRKGWSSFWGSDFDEMAKKTIIRQLISKWGIMSVEMEQGYVNDMAVIGENGETNYIDNVPDEPTPAVDVYVNAEVVEEKDGAERTELPQSGSKSDIS